MMFTEGFGCFALIVSEVKSLSVPSEEGHSKFVDIPFQHTTFLRCDITNFRCRALECLWCMHSKSYCRQSLGNLLRQYSQVRDLLLQKQSICALGIRYHRRGTWMLQVSV